MQMTVELSEEQAARLDRLSLEKNAPLAVLLSEALNAYLWRNSSSPPAESNGVTPAAITDPEERRQNLLKYFGALPDLEDGMAFQDRLRNEWVREWDPEYDPKIHG